MKSRDKTSSRLPIARRFRTNDFIGPVHPLRPMVGKPLNGSDEASNCDVGTILKRSQLLAVAEDPRADCDQGDVECIRVGRGEGEDVPGVNHPSFIGNLTAYVNGDLTGRTSFLDRSSYRTMELDLSAILARVEARLKALGLTANAASQLAKKPDAIRNLKRAVSKGERTGITTGTIAALAPVLETSASWLLEGREEQQANRPVPVMGRIGAGAEIMPEFEQLPPEGLFEIETMVPVPAGSIAFEVEGDSMWPRYDPGDVVLCWREGTDAEEVIGWEAAVRTKDGRRFLKRILKGSTPGTFDLESYNSPPIRGVKLDWVAHVGMVVRAGQWNRLSTKERAGLLRKNVVSS